MLENERINIISSISPYKVLRTLSPSETPPVPGPVAVGFGHTRHTGKTMKALSWDHEIHGQGIQC